MNKNVKHVKGMLNVNSKQLFLRDWSLGQDIRGAGLTSRIDRKLPEVLTQQIKNYFLLPLLYCIAIAVHCIAVFLY